MSDVNNILGKLKIEENIWIIYLIIIFLSFVSNKFEKKYYIFNDNNSKENYRNFNILIFSIALVIYGYFFKDGYDSLANLKSCTDKNKLFFNRASFTASTLILIAGTIFLYIAINDINLDTELAFS
ncbi:MAG: hypothetical protein E7160_01175 [Firmicutes bacterium]|nr:hypothetical protein [Bacillota bacterium]